MASWQNHSGQTFTALLWGLEPVILVTAEGTWDPFLSPSSFCFDNQNLVLGP